MIGEMDRRKLFSAMGRRRGRRSHLMLIGAMVALLVSCALVGAAQAGAGAHPVVATVVSVTGGGLYVKHSPGATLSPLRPGGHVYLGDIIAAGPGVTAALKLTAPEGTPATTTLLGVYKLLTPAEPVPSTVVAEFDILAASLTTHHTLTILRSGSHISLQLAP